VRYVLEGSVRRAATDLRMEQSRHSIDVIARQNGLPIATAWPRLPARLRTAAQVIRRNARAELAA